MTDLDTAIRAELTTHYVTDDDQDVTEDRATERANALRAVLDLLPAMESHGGLAAAYADQLRAEIATAVGVRVDD
ncbi:MULTISPECIES: hypothetical protein [unclassified Saccharopolyspora]|uniref:hypothetical protein n=1 Tax=unclassified Saccharopolyspora TaxID=2646250 RepID=UPI001CD751ED|nr:MULTISPECIES: hypothetical protein [unclassified Saccharopolyspora]MCA1185776.1 hypothetical protein [Saccharopolyspora sp. 6T]MCA1191688.1 hypothetical protein [Saccharopolyspora sp. 6V]